MAFIDFTMAPTSRKSTYAILVVLLFASLLRFWELGELPPGLHYDEAADTIIAREIAEGRSAPIFVEAYTGKEVLFFYWAAGWMKLIGATPFAMRLAAAMLGVVTVAATYRAVRELFAGWKVISPGGRRRESTAPAGIALLAAAFMATSFWHVLMSRLGFRSIAEPCVQALAAAALWRGVRLSHRGWLIAGGGLAGLNLYTYLAARLFPVAVALAFVYLIVAGKARRRERVIRFGWMVAAAVAVFAPLGIYFLQHPGAFLTRIAQVAPREGQSAELASNILRALGMFFVDGDPYVRFNLPGRPLFPVILGVLFMLGVMVCTAGVFRSRSPLRRAVYFFLSTSTLIMLLPTALAVNEITPSNLRAIGTMPMVFVFPAMGLWIILKRMRALREGGRMIIGRAFILALLVFAGVETGLSYFNQYVRLPALYYESDGDLVDVARLLNTLDAQQTPIYVHALHYRHPTLAALARDFHLHRSLTGADVLAFPPGRSIHIFAHLALPDQAWLAEYLPETASVEEAPGPDGRTAFAVVEVNSQPPVAPQMPLDVNYGDTLELLGTSLASPPESGSVIDVTLFWRVLNPPDHGDHAVFAELRDAWDFRWGQADSFDYPPEQWTPGESIVQRLRVPIAPGAPPGDYRLDVGWFSASANRRMPVVAKDGSFGGTVAALKPISVSRAPQPPDKETLGIGTRLDAEVVDGLRLLGASVETPIVPQGAPLFITLFWQAEGELEDLPIAVELRSAAGGASYGLSAGAPVHGTYPFDAWVVGEIVADRRGLRVPVDAAAGDYTLEVRAGRGAWIEFGQVRIEATDRRFEVPPIAHPLDVTFGDQIDLLGYELDRMTMRPGESITLTLVWRARRIPAADYTVFTHLLDASRVQRGGKDNPPVNGTYPTSRWIEDEVVLDTFVIPLEAGAPPGEYTVEIGLYRFDSGERLPVSAGGDALPLATFRVAP